MRTKPLNASPFGKTQRASRRINAEFYAEGLRKAPRTEADAFGCTHRFEHGRKLAPPAVAGCAVSTATAMQTLLE